MDKMITYLESRIKELNEADAKFCESRWDMAKPKFEREYYRQASNEVHARRMELETVLQLAQTLKTNEDENKGPDHN
jgi:hypothetical protein